MSLTSINFTCLKCPLFIKRSISTTSQLNRLRSEWRVDRKPANTLLSTDDVTEERKAFGGRKKVKAIKMSRGVFSLPTQNFEAVLPIVDVLHSDAGPQYREKQILAKGVIVSVDVSEQKVNIDVEKILASLTESTHSLGKLVRDNKLYAKITTRPGQVGKCDGEILEDAQLNQVLETLKQYVETV